MTPIGSPHLTDDGILDLTAGLVDGEPRARLLDHLTRCVRCERRLLESWRDSERAASRPVPSAVPLRAVTPCAGKGTTRSRVPRVAFLAAAVVVAVLAALPILRPDREPLAFDHWLAIDSERVLLRSAETAGDGVYAEALAAYARRDARRVVDLLGARPIPPSHEPITILLASALLGDGRPAEARRLLEAMDVPTLPQPARDRARWILAAALAGEDRPDEARPLLRRLSESPGGEYAERARAALRALGETATPINAEEPRR